MPGTFPSMQHLKGRCYTAESMKRLGPSPEYIPTIDVVQAQHQRALVHTRTGGSRQTKNRAWCKHKQEKAHFAALLSRVLCLCLCYILLSDTLPIKTIACTMQAL